MNNTKTTTFLKFPVQFDVEKLKRELEVILQSKVGASF